MSDRWYVLRVKPRKERAVYQLLQSKDMTVYYPVVRVKPKNPRSAKERPYFPGYMFVRADLEEVGTNAFSWMPGTRGLVSFGGVPAIVPVNLIRELQQRLAVIEAEGGLAFSDLEPGDPVRIVEGPFSGFEAIFDARLPDSQRVQVLLAFLSDQPQRVRLDVNDIEKLE